MKRIDWNAEKDAVLVRERGISFIQIQSLIEAGHVLDVVDHPNKSKYANQRIFILNISGYIWSVPFVEDAETIFLKTAIPSRKLTRDYQKDKSHATK